MSAHVTGLWSKKDLAEAHRLNEACQANGAHWAFADWLLLKEPVQPSSVTNGCHARLKVLAYELQISNEHLRDLRRCAHAWPVEYRVPNATFDAHRRFTVGGREAAAARSEALAARPTNRFGKAYAMPTRTRSVTIAVGSEMYAVIAREAAVTGKTLAATTRELIQESLDARAWLASEVAA